MKKRIRTRLHLPALLALLCACGGVPATATTSPRAPAAALAPAIAPTSDAPPVARTVDVIDALGGQQIADPYRWMEGADNAEFDTWLGAQGRYAAQAFERLQGRDALHARIRALGLGTSVVSAPVRLGEQLFYELEPAGAQVPRLEVRDAKGMTRVLVDPATLGKGGSHVTVDNFNPSPDGTLLAYNLSPGGSEITSIHVLRTQSGAALPDRVDQVWGEFAATWLPDGSGFFYTQMAEPVAGVDPMFNMRVRLHRLGTPMADDPTVLGNGVGSTMTFEAKEFTTIDVPLGSSWMIANGLGARPEQRMAVARLADLDESGAGKTPWKLVSHYEDGVQGGTVFGDRLYLLTHKNAPHRRIVSVPLTEPDLAKARVEVAESSDASIESFAAANDGLYILDRIEGHARVRRLPWKERAPSTLALPYSGSITRLASDPRRDGVTLDLAGWTHPAEVLSYDPRTNALSSTGLRTITPAEPDRFVAEEVEVTSADGTRVPLSVLRKKELTLDGSRPAIVYGYGGYAVPLTPWFSPTLPVWLERGGLYAVCHVRGGGEKGESWHEAGARGNKKNGVDDFVACAEYLVKRGYTSPARMAAAGASMGGVLIGRVITARPELFAAAHISVGIVNPLRILQAENGANQLAELGSPETDAGLRGLIAMDPYTHVARGGAYPAVLFTIGLHDRRVSPWMTGKMAARLQASSASGKPVLVRVDADTGHGIGSTRDQAYAERGDVWSFLLAAFGDADFEARKD
jgi:prolyl oligopeptidase